jgi:hypothetical protein
MIRRILPLLVAVVCVAFAQKYEGPRPPKPDLPYLKHADNLIPTEAVQAVEDKQKKDDVLYVVQGANSPARTPLVSPIFLMRADKLSPDKLGLYKLDVKGDHREILFGPKKQPRSIRVDVTRLDGNLYKIEVDESLDPGEYSLSPEGSNQVFCFQVY